MANLRVTVRHQPQVDPAGIPLQMCYATLDHLGGQNYALVLRCKRPAMFQGDMPKEARIAAEGTRSQMLALASHMRNRIQLFEPLPPEMTGRQGRLTNILPE